MPYDPRPLLRKLEEDSSEITQREIYSEFWNELHHQGDVDLASYATLPTLVRIFIESDIQCWDFFALIAVIEISRHEAHNPKLPDYMEEEYHTGLKWVAMVASSVPDDKWDSMMISSYCAAVAASKGDRLLALGYLEMTRDDVAEYLTDNIGSLPS